MISFTFASSSAKISTVMTTILYDASAVIDTIRLDVINMIKLADNKHHIVDGWDENRLGVAWIDNELSLLDNLLYRTSVHHQSPYSQFGTVDQCKTYLEQKGDDYIKVALGFCKSGGTSNKYHFDLRDRNDDDEINRYVSQL